MPNPMFTQNDTIAAISTPKGTGGIAVIRVSGPDAIGAVDGLFRGKVKLSEGASHRAYVGRLVAEGHGQLEPVDDPGLHAGEVLDEVVVSLFRKPHSYTGEDVVEISCHGGQFISHRVLEAVVACGVRIADPGEFTRRAFLNGRLDLAQAEAVADIIQAKTAWSLKAALSRYGGALSGRVREIRQELIDLCSLLELELDFAEEDVEFADRAEVERQLEASLERIQSFAQTYERGKILREGARLVIVGKPNVGKSSLLNALLKEDRAIVTEVPGTTRDVLEEQLDLRGVYFRVVDTAGVREATERVEREGVQRTLDQIRKADVVLFLFDGSGRLDAEDERLMAEVRRVRGAEKNSGICAINKIDLPKRLSTAALRERFPGWPVLEISAAEHRGLEALEAALVEKAVGWAGDPGSEVLVSNLRQKAALEKALAALASAQRSLRSGMSPEFVAVDLRAGMEHLGEIIGEVTTEDILGNIFSKFCIGK